MDQIHRTLQTVEVESRFRKENNARITLLKSVLKHVLPILRAALHLEAGPIHLEANWMKFQPFLGWRPASTTHYNKIIAGVNFLICKGLRTKKLGRFNISSIFRRI